MDGYSHTQKSPLCLLVYGTAIAVFISVWFVQSEPPTAFILVGTGIFAVLMATALHHLIGTLMIATFTCNPRRLVSG